MVGPRSAISPRSPVGSRRPSFVHDRDLGTGGLADRTRLASFQRVRGNLGSGFRHAVGLDHRDAKQRFQSAEHVGRQRRRGRANEPQGVLLDVVFVATRRRQQRPMDCRNRRVPGWSKLRQPTEEGGGIESVACRPHSTRPPTQPAAPRSGHAHGTAAAHSAIGPAIQVPMSRPRYRPTDRRSPASVGPSSAATYCPRSTR